MHPSPAYARLQVISRIRADLIQRLRSLSVLATSGTLPTDIGSRFALAINRLDRATRALEDDCFTRQAPEIMDANVLERQVRTEFGWLTESVERLYSAMQKKCITIESCDEVLECIQQRKTPRRLSHDLNPPMPNSTDRFDENLPQNHPVSHVSAD